MPFPSCSFARAVSIGVLLVLCGCPPPSEGAVPIVQTAMPAPTATTPHMAPEAAAAGGQIERLTSGPGDELYPAPNRDGSVFLFQEETFDGSGADRKLASQLVYGMHTAKPGERELYSTAGRASLHPSFSPDGGSYIYISNALGPLAMVHSQSPAATAAISVIVSSDLAPEAGEPAISPDGARVAFSLRDKNGGRSVAVIRTGGEKQITISEGRAPAWSPDGRGLYFVRTIDGYNHIVRVDAINYGNMTQITHGNIDCDHPTLSPNGRYLAFASNAGHEALQRKRSEVLQLWASKIDGSGMIQLTDGTARSATPSWGKDGWIYFSSDREGSFDIYRLKPGGDLAAP